MMTTMMESSFGDVIMKVALFVIVQALVYFILTSSSDVFSKKTRSFSFKQARSSSINRILNTVSDLPLGGDPTSPSPRSRRNYDSSLE
ncbi:hypothetical protein UlMin_033737 [Ulmus minor]